MTIAPPSDQEMSIVEHLRVLRKHVTYSLLSIVIGMAVAFYFVDDIWLFLVDPLQQALDETSKGTMAIHNVFEGLITKLKVAALAGLLLSSPFVSYQIWLFIAPALYDNEAKMIIPLSIASSALFLLGVSFGYFVIFQFIFPFFLEMTTENVEAVLSINSYLMTATKLLLAFGVTFQLPVVTFFLARVGLINHHDMLSGFRYAIVVILVVSAFITPPDPLSQLLMAIPLIVLYVVGIGITYFFSTKSTDDDTDKSVSIF